MGLRVGGLATGIDTAALIEGLMAAERRPLDLVQQQKSILDTHRSLFRDLNTKLLALRDAASALDNQSSFLSGPSFDEEFLKYTASVSDDSVLTATASGNASPGSVDVTVDQLATVARRITTGFSSAEDLVFSAGETLTVAYGGDADIELTVGAGGANLQDLASLIDSDENNDGSIQAEVIFDGTNYRMVVSGTQTGLANDVTVSGTVPGEGGSPFLDAALGQSADDAQFQVFGIPMTRTSNDFSDAIPGVAISLRGVSADPVTVDVALDSEAISEQLQTFVDAYNSVTDFISAQIDYDPANEAAGPLSGDATVRSVQRTVQRLLVQGTTFANNPFSSLGQIGVNVDRDGQLTLDSEQLTTALEQDPLAVREFLSGDGTEDGFATAMARALDPITETGEGTLALRDSALEDRIGGLDLQITRLELRLEQREELLVLQFSRLESTVSTLQAQGNSLLSLFTGQQ